MAPQGSDAYARALERDFNAAGAEIAGLKAEIERLRGALREAAALFPEWATRAGVERLLGDG